MDKAISTIHSLQGLAHDCTNWAVHCDTKRHTFALCSLGGRDGIQRKKTAKIKGIYQRGESWCCQYWVNKKKVRKSFATRTEAIDHLDKVRRLEREGNAIPQSAKAPLLDGTERQRRLAGSSLLLETLSIP